MSTNPKNNTRGLPPSEPVDLAGGVSYQAGSIVSRVLAKRSGGTLTLFAFDAEQSLSEHSAPFDALVQVLEGRAEVDARHLFQAPDLPETPSAISILDIWKV